MKLGLRKVAVIEMAARKLAEKEGENGKESNRQGTT